MGVRPLRPDDARRTHLLPIPPISALFGTHLGGTATGNIWVTATLAVMTLGLIPPTCGT